jgi:hypothetical protein
MRLLCGVLGGLLVVTPAWLLFDTMVPVAQYRTGTFADYAGAARACLTLYSGATIGIVVLWWRRTQKPQLTDRRDVFRACFAGAMAAVGAAIVAAGGGNLFGVAVIFGVAFSAIIAAGGALVWQALAPWKAEAA